MSWNPFNRHTAPKKSVISRTEERELVKEIKKLDQQGETSKKLQKDAKRWVEANNAVAGSEHKITQDLLSCQLCQSEPEFYKQIEEWNKTVEKQAQSTRELNGTVQKTVVEPVKKLNGVYPSIDIAIKKREQSLQEYMKSQAKLEKYQERERTGQNIVKLETSKKSLISAKEDFTSQNNALKEDIPKFIDMRTEYIQPSLESLIKSQVALNAESVRLYTELSEHMGSKEDNSIQQTLTEIKALSITVD
ncbi:bridging integrator 3 [Mytilus galloprovincialis]|uniref:Bridging integrator 3 n=1 Tax=Mytilus galloprovincialis TaxID=29158 RepID=A0A8B6F8C5_MYTGA|nr:bridging integrator 3 [Mytilus galloprovincialis]